VVTCEHVVIESSPSRVSVFCVFVLAVINMLNVVFVIYYYHHHHNRKET
jgi:hypothetical protein